MPKRNQVSWETFLWTIVLFLFAFGLRFFALEARAPFDWDQNRDYSQVEQIAGGSYIALGPVAKGVGGFYLGSFYYYLLYPAYKIFGSDLIALPLTSIILDSLVVALIYLLTRRWLGKWESIALASLWCFTWFLVEASRVSWNVALIPLWSLMTIISLSEVVKNGSAKFFYLLAVLAGLTLHIHVTTIPVIPLLLLLFWRKLAFPISVWFKAIVFGFIPVLPLAIYDLTHYFYNLHLLKDFLSYRARVDTTYLSMIPMSLTKLGKVVSGIFLAKFRDSLILGAITIFFAIFAIRSDKVILRVSGLMTIIATTLIILFRDYGFPEYYFTLAYLPICLIVVDLIIGHLKLGGYLILLAFIVLNMSSYTFEATGFSLKNKRAIVQTLTKQGKPIDISYSFDPGRDGGLRQLIRLEGITLDPKSKYRILLTDKLNTPLYIDGELARDLEQIGSIKSALYVVQ